MATSFPYVRIGIARFKLSERVVSVSASVQQLGFWRSIVVVGVFVSGLVVGAVIDLFRPRVPAVITTEAVEHVDKRLESISQSVNELRRGLDALRALKPSSPETAEREPVTNESSEGAKDEVLEMKAMLSEILAILTSPAKTRESRTEINWKRWREVYLVYQRDPGAASLLLDGLSPTDVYLEFGPPSEAEAFENGDEMWHYFLDPSLGTKGGEAVVTIKRGLAAGASFPFCKGRL